MLRRVPVIGADGLLVGRELAATVGIVGMPPAARPMASCSAPSAPGGRLRPRVHASPTRCGSAGACRWACANWIEAPTRRACCWAYFSRYRGCSASASCPTASPTSADRQPAHSAAVRRARAGPCWPDRAAWPRPGSTVEPAPRRGRRWPTSHRRKVTPRVASTTRESRMRSAGRWLRRIDELVADRAGPQPRVQADGSGRAADLEDGPSAA